MSSWCSLNRTNNCSNNKSHNNNSSNINSSSSHHRRLPRPHPPTGPKGEINRKSLDWCSPIYNGVHCRRYLKKRNDPRKRCRSPSHNSLDSSWALLATFSWMHAAVVKTSGWRIHRVWSMVMILQHRPSSRTMAIIRIRPMLLTDRCPHQCSPWAPTLSYPVHEKPEILLNKIKISKKQTQTKNIPNKTEVEFQLHYKKAPHYFITVSICFVSNSNFPDPLTSHFQKSPQSPLNFVHFE